MLGAYILSAGKGRHPVEHAVTLALGFWGVIRWTAQFSRHQSQAMGIEDLV